MNFDLIQGKINKPRLIAAIVYMGIPLYLSFGILDYFYSEEHWLTFVEIRVFTCFVMGIIAMTLHKIPQDKEWLITYLGNIVTFMMGAGIGYMSYLTGGLNSPYYAGLNWIAIGSLAFWPSKPHQIVVSILTIFSPIFIITFFRGDNLLNITSILSITFMLGTIVLSVLINSLSTDALKKEFDLREKLEHLNKNKDILIQKKSSDIASLKTLAKQFSPEVIRAIESQSLSLTQRDRKEVTIIFIDIESSTLRANTIDHTSYQAAIDTFFNLAIKKLMENNITVANFMGDGLMAIANAPYSMINHCEEAVRSCFDIINETQKIQKHLDQLWQTPFRIRIGISTGFANVGFFPNSNFGVYTAIGDTVNLSARLCSAASPHSVAMTKDVVLESEALLDTVKVKSAGSLSNLKGFDKFQVNYFIATPEFSHNTDVNECPLCSSLLLPPKDLGDSILLRCTSCNFSDLEPIDEYRKRSAA